MAKSARTMQLQTLFETHLIETEEQVERLNQPGDTRNSRAWEALQGDGGTGGGRGGNYAEGKNKDDAPADLALIGAAQRVGHYEIAASTSARNLALQLHQCDIADLLTLSLGEEENAGQLLNQVSQPLMAAA